MIPIGAELLYKNKTAAAATSQPSRHASRQAAAALVAAASATEHHCHPHAVIPHQAMQYNMADTNSVTNFMPLHG